MNKQMRIIHRKIAEQKKNIMINLELNNCDKSQLDKDIAKLQMLQKEFIQFEQLTMCQLPNNSEYDIDYIECCGKSGSKFFPEKADNLNNALEENSIDNDFKSHIRYAESSQSGEKYQVNEASKSK